MAFPVVQLATTGAETGNTTAHAIAIPATVNAGDLLIAMIVFDGAPTVTWDQSTAGTWTLIHNTPNGTACRGVAYAKVADGTEGGLTLSITTSASEQSVYRCVRINQWNGALATGLANGTAATGTSTTPNPPAVTPSWGSDDHLWIAICYYDFGTTTVSAYPANFTEGQFNDTSGGGAGCGLGSSRRQLATNTQDPGTYTISASRAWVAQTLAIRGKVVQSMPIPRHTTSMHPALLAM